MDKWLEIIMTVEEMWEADSYGQYLTNMGCNSHKYRIERDLFKARRIYDLYGYEYFVRFVDRCPHIHDILKEYVPCRNDG